MAENEAQQENWGEGLNIDGKSAIYPEKPLPNLNTVGGAAFAARSKSDPSQELVGIICSRGLLPRVEHVHAMKVLDTSSVLRLHDAGVVYWPAQNASYYALVFERPSVGRFWTSLDDTHTPMSEDVVNHTFVFPMIKALAEFRRVGIVHGGIRPTNIFWHTGSTSAPQIGDGISAPCGVGQPVIFETIERGMCAPMARGSGLHADDCYALGITLAMVVLGSNPLRGLDDASIIRMKLEKGTFTAIIGNKRLAATHIELLRGLLADDPRQRWTADDLEQWMTGRRLTPKSSDAGRRASRHFDIAGKEYWHPRSLAIAMAENVAEAVKVIESGSLVKWLIRSLGDEERSKCVSETIEESQENGKGAHYQDLLVARTCLALDPSAPIRYRGMSVMPLGIGSAIVEGLTNNQNLQILHEIIASQLVPHWVNMQKDAKADLLPIAQLFERLRGYVERTSFGHGIERVLYELNPSIPCLSPLFKNNFVLTLKQILPALERAGSTGAHATDPVDRHIAAFIVARDKRSEAIFTAMSPTEPPLKRGLAMLSLFGEMQYRYGPDRLPHLCGWLMPLVEPCFKRFLSKPLQEKVRRQAKEAVEKGSLSQLLQRVDDPARVVGDENDFIEARRMYRNIKAEQATLEDSMKKKERIALDIGRPVAASIASLLALIFIAVTLWRVFWNGLIG